MTAHYRRTYVCFTCMRACRRTLKYGEATCPDCHRSMISLNYKARIPKRDAKLWKEFKEWLGTTYPYYRQFTNPEEYCSCGTVDSPGKCAKCNLPHRWGPQDEQTRT